MRASETIATAYCHRLTAGHSPRAFVPPVKVAARFVSRRFFNDVTVSFLGGSVISYERIQ